MTATAEALGLSRHHLSSTRSRPPPRIRGRPPRTDGELVAEIRALIAELPTYGYGGCTRSCAARPRRTAADRPIRSGSIGDETYGLLLQRHSGRGEDRRQEGRVAVDERNTRWCSDGLEIGCENGEKMRVAFALDCCDREAMGYVATTAGISAEDGRDLIVASVEHRFGQLNRLPRPIEWLTDNSLPSGLTRGAAATRPARHAASRATSASNLGPHPSRAHRATAWPSLRAHPQARLRPRQPQARRPIRAPAAARLDRPLTTPSTRTAPWATAPRASTSPVQPRRPRQAFRGQQHIFLRSAHFGVL